MHVDRDAHALRSIRDAQVQERLRWLGFARCRLAQVVDLNVKNGMTIQGFGFCSWGAIHWRRRRAVGADPTRATDGGVNSRDEVCKMRCARQLGPYQQALGGSPIGIRPRWHVASWRRPHDHGHLVLSGPAHQQQLESRKKYGARARRSARGQISHGLSEWRVEQRFAAFGRANLSLRPARANRQVRGSTPRNGSRSAQSRGRSDGGGFSVPLGAASVFRGIARHAARESSAFREPVWVIRKPGSCTKAPIHIRAG